MTRPVVANVIVHANVKIVRVGVTTGCRLVCYNDNMVGMIGVDCSTCSTANENLPLLRLRKERWPKTISDHSGLREWSALMR